ncbi:MAG TPA: NAD(P)H-dependent dehydrogenase/reductase [Firmicutes bacterium]|jgi:nitroreductase|nr:NAD(P)H-dependent dehydrogenase/reductase [Bacillota bacterium]
MTLSLIQKRRSIRKFLKTPVEPEKIAVLIEAALRAPSSRGLKPWEFVVIDKAGILEKLANSKPYGSAFLKNAVLGIVICADPKRCDVWIEDSSIAATYIQLTAQSLGLGSCWVQIRERMCDSTRTAEESVRDVLEIPEHLRVDSLIAIGYPAEDLPAHSQDELQYEKVYYNRYGEKAKNAK